MDKSICSYDPLKIASDKSNISQNLDKNTPRILLKLPNDVNSTI